MLPRFATYILLGFFSGVGAAQDSSSCADCHFANMYGAVGTVTDSSGSDDYSNYDSFHIWHINAWESSPHGRSSVGCERCHGGNETSFEAFQAHRGVLNSRNPASPAHFKNLPRTCGTCHVGQFVAFQKSQHYALLQEGNEDVPVCATCHGPVAAQLLSPKSLERQCRSCHAENKRFPRPGYPIHAREMLEDIVEIRGLLKDARSLIRRVKDSAQRELLEEAYNQAEVPLEEAVYAGHSFVFEQLHERRDVAKRRAEALLERLANPSQN